MPRLIVPSSGGGRKLIRTLRAGEVVGAGDVSGDGDAVGVGVAVGGGVSCALARLTTPRSRTSKCGRDELRLVPK